MKEKFVSTRNKDIVKRAKEKLERTSYLVTSIVFTDVVLQDPWLIYISPPNCKPNPSGCAKLKTHKEWLLQ